MISNKLENSRNEENIIQINLQLKNINDINETNSNILIKVNQYDTIYSLNAIINDQLNIDEQERNRKRFRFFHNGIDLNANSAFSLAFLGVKNNDTITVYAEYMPNKDLISTPNNTENNHRLFDLFYRGEEKRLEQGRIRDILLSRIEGTSIFYRKNVFRFEQMVTDDAKSKKKYSGTVIEDSQGAPSTHMLPQAWSEGK